MKTKFIRMVVKEAKFLRSFKDAKNLYHKITYAWPKFYGRSYKHRRVPPSLQLEPTNYCDLDCTCCSSSRSFREKGYMDFPLFQKIIDDAALLRIRRVHLYLHGEPMLHPKIVDMIRYIKSKDIGFHLTTNGMRIDEETITALLHSGVDNADHFLFSILGHDRSTHESIMRGVDHDRVIENVLNFVRLRRAFGINGPIIETILYKMPENEGETGQFQQYWRGKVDHVQMGGRISKYFSEHNTNVSTSTPRTYACSKLWNRMAVYWDGRVTLCCADVDGAFVLGDLNHQSIQEIWNSKRLLGVQKLHKMKRYQDVPLCAKCDV